MSHQQKLNTAMAYAMKKRPAVGGFPFLAQCLFQAGVKQNIWHLPSCQSTYVFEDGALVQQGQPLATGLLDVPTFNQDALIAAIRADQEGKSTFPEFLLAAWQAGVVSYTVDFESRTVTYLGAMDEKYIEEYAEVNSLNIIF